VCRFEGSPGAATLNVEDGNAPGNVEADDNPLLFTQTVFYDFKADPAGSASSDTVAIVGLTKDHRVKSVSVTRPHRAAVEAQVRGGTFILTGIGLNENSNNESDLSIITAFDSAGQVLGTTEIRL
jgi:hypothetical protein